MNSCSTIPVHREWEMEKDFEMTGGEGVTTGGYVSLLQLSVKMTLRDISLSKIQRPRNAGARVGYSPSHPLSPPVPHTNFSVRRLCTVFVCLLPLRDPWKHGDVRQGRRNALTVFRFWILIKRAQTKLMLLRFTSLLTMRIAKVSLNIFWKRLVVGLLN